MESLTTTFDDKRYPYKYMLKAPVSGAGGLQNRLLSAAQNIGFDMPMARQFVEDYDAQGRGASYQYHLFAVALTQEDQYPRLLDELDRLTVEHIQDIDRHQREHAGLSHSESLLRDYAEQDEQLPQTRAIGYEDLGRDGKLSIVRDDLLADYMEQPAPPQIERDTLDDDWALGL